MKVTPESKTGEVALRKYGRSSRTMVGQRTRWQKIKSGIRSVLSAAQRAALRKAQQAAATLRHLRRNSSQKAAYAAATRASEARLAELKALTKTSIAAKVARQETYTRKVVAYLAGHYGRRKGLKEAAKFYRNRDLQIFSRKGK